MILQESATGSTKGVKRPGKGKQQPPTKWNSSTITKILSLQEYCGDILNFKTYSKSYKNKKRIDNDRENWVVFKDVHEPIIDRAVWEQVQQKRGKVRKRRTNEGEKQKEREHFIKAIRKFMQMERLTAPLLRELIDKIEVFETEGVGKNRTQRIVIYYRFVGYIELPEATPSNNYKANTRKGVSVEYLPKQLTA